jgi:hypothetical protein
MDDAGFRDYTQYGRLPATIKADLSAAAHDPALSLGP